MAWRAAKSINQLRKQINEQFPTRSKAADGMIGDAAHASRSSDHNPWVKDGNTGVVTAIDITHDPVNGVDSEKLAEVLLNSRDPRIKYVISNKKIASGADGPKPWVWRKYGGSNPHNHHVHLSVEDTKSLYDSERPWDLSGMDGTPDPAAPWNPVLPMLRRGDEGEYVERLQKALIKAGHSIKADGDFGAKTDRAVRIFQRASGLHPDGIVGPYTWEKLNG